MLVSVERKTLEGQKHAELELYTEIMSCLVFHMYQYGMWLLELDEWMNTSYMAVNTYPMKIMFCLKNIFLEWIGQDIMHCIQGQSHDYADLNYIQCMHKRQPYHR